jgi:hypothetical protein
MTHWTLITAELHDDKDDDEDDDDDDDEQARSMTGGTVSLLFEIREQTAAIFSVRSISCCQYDVRKLPVFLS